MPELLHELRLTKTRDEKARASFVAGLRQHVLERMAGGLRTVYLADVEPRLRRTNNAAPDGAAVHRALRGHEYFQFYSALRVCAQAMLFQVVAPALERERDSLHARARVLAERAPLGSLTLRDDFELPRSVTAIDVHLMAGGYTSEYGTDDLMAGAVYDNRLAAFSMGLMGRNLDDIGQSISQFVGVRYPQFTPGRILDLGCTIGHNTGAWKDSFPDAEVFGIDVAAPGLRYGLPRARSQGRAIHFRQMNAEALEFPEASFDVVFSSMFLHEVPCKGIARVLREAHRVLRPGGLMLHMEVPPNSKLSAYDGFYLDWDGYYNNEPYYKPFRDLDPQTMVRQAGFSPENFLEFVVPSLGALGPERWREAVKREHRIDDSTGRLASGVRWYCFGAWK